jgi:hypothetical protein
MSRRAWLLIELKRAAPAALFALIRQRRLAKLDGTSDSTGR